MMDLQCNFTKSFILFVIAIFGFSSLVFGAKDFDADSGYLYVDDDNTGTIVEEIPPWNPNIDHRIHARWKRTTSQDFEINLKEISGYMRKLEKMQKEMKNLPPGIQNAIKSADFSNVTQNDIRQVNVTILEFIPTKLMEKINGPVLEEIISKFLLYNRPNALGRLMDSSIGRNISPATLIDKIDPQNSPESNEAASVLLYSAMRSLGEIGGFTGRRVDQLKQKDLLKYVPEEQFMKVNDSDGARLILQYLYGQSNNKNNPEVNEPDDKALAYKLIEVENGTPKKWSGDKVRNIVSKFLKFLPAASIKEIPASAIHESILNIRDGHFDNPLQAKTVTDTYLETAGFKKNEDGQLVQATHVHGRSVNFQDIFQNLQKLSAFINPSAVNNSGLLNRIIESCDKWNISAPLLAVTKVLKQMFRDKPVSQMTKGDLLPLSPSFLKNAPPELIGKAMETDAIDLSKVKEIAKTDSDRGQGIYGNFFKGVISQLTNYVVRRFQQAPNSNKYNIGDIPAAFVGGIGVRGIQEMDSDLHKLEDLLDKVKKNPDALNDEQKVLILKKFGGESLLDGKFPPEFAFLLPREKGSEINPDHLGGLPSDSELRLAYGENEKHITPNLLERYPNLVGTLTPKQVEHIELQYIPGVLAAVRRSKDGPQPQTLKALSKRFAEYIKQKSDESEDIEDKKLLKHVSAAEISKIPASVLAYFIDHKQTAKLSVSVRKELMIALGEMSTKDRELIPHKTREEIIIHGLDALDRILVSQEKTYDLPELAAIGHNVNDLPPKYIRRLTPVAFEQALDLIQGTTEVDGGLKQRACLNSEQKHAWRNKIIENYGKPKTWDPATVTSLCCALPILEEDDLMSINKESIVTCKCISDSDPPTHLRELKKSLDRSCEKKLGYPDRTKRIFDRVKSERAMDLNELESQIITRKKRAHNHSNHKRSLSCFAIRLAGNPSEFDKDTLSTIKPKDIKNCLYELGSVKLGREEERILWEKLVESQSGRQINNIPWHQLRQAGYILTGIKEDEVQQLDFSNDDVVAAFGRQTGFSKPLLTKFAEQIEMKRRRKLYQPEDLIIVRNFLCGFDIDTLQRIVPETFRAALPIIRDLDPNCEISHLAVLAHITSHDTVFGNPANWTASDVRGIGILFKGLHLEDLKRIPPEAFLGVTPTVASSLNEHTLGHLTNKQLSFIPRFSAQAMSDSQINALSSDGREALQATLRGPHVTGGSQITTIITNSFLPITFLITIQFLFL